ATRARPLRSRAARGLAAGAAPGPHREDASARGGGDHCESDRARQRQPRTRGCAVIVDVDTHWESISYEHGEHPLAPWLDELPSRVDMLALGVAGDLLRALPPEDRPTAHELLPALVRNAES